MQSARDYLAAEADRKLTEAATLAENASKATRSMTTDERKQAEDLLAEATQIKSRVDDIDDNEKLRGDLERIRGQFNEPVQQAPAGAKSIGDAFVKSDAYASMKAGFQTGQMGGQWTSGPVELPDFKATVTTTASPIIQNDVLGGIRESTAVSLRRLTIEDLLASGTTDSGTVRYLREITNTNAAAAVTEGDAKPESTITFDQVDEPVRKVATFLPVSDEMLEDEAQIRSYLDNRLRLFVEHAKETQILSGSGAAPQLRGLLNRVGIQTGTRSALAVTLGEVALSTTVATAVYAAITAIRVNARVEPDGIVMHPTNWAAFKTSKDGNGQFFGGGPFTGPYGNGGIAGETAWGLPVVVTSAITVNTALVGAFGTMAQVFYRNGLTVEASNSHSDFFQKNLTAIRAEQRLALAVYRPEAFHAITALQTA